MRKLVIVAAATALLTVSTAHAADAASKYSVTLSVSSTGEVGRSLTLSGKVSPAAKGKSVKVERKYAGGSWTTVGSDTLSSSSTYSVSIKPSRAGVASYRVTKAASGSRHSGVSTTKVVKVYRWRYVTDLPLLSSAEGATKTNSATILGRTFTKSVVITNSTGFLEFNTADRCTKFTAIVGMDDSSNAGSSAYASYNALTGSGGAGGPDILVTQGSFASYVTSDDYLPGTSNLSLYAYSVNPGEKVVFGSPMVYCAS